LFYGTGLISHLLKEEQREGAGQGVHQGLGGFEDTQGFALWVDVNVLFTEEI
jgi:hypothetical protein